MGVCVCRRDKVVIISNPASVISEFIGDGLVLQMLHKFVSRTDENSGFWSKGGEMSGKDVSAERDGAACSEIDLSEWAHFLWMGLVDILIWKVEKSQTWIDLSDLWVCPDRASCGGVLLISSDRAGQRYLSAPLNIRTRQKVSTSILTWISGGINPGNALPTDTKKTIPALSVYYSESSHVSGSCILKFPNIKYQNYPTLIF